MIGGMGNRNMDPVDAVRRQNIGGLASNIQCWNALAVNHHLDILPCDLAAPAGF